MRIAALACVAALASVAALALAACDEAPGAGDAASPLADTRLTLLEVGDTSAERPMLMRLSADGRGDMRYAVLDLTYRWITRGDQLCLSDLRLEGLPSDDPSEQCAQFRISGSQIIIDALGPGQEGNRMSGTIAPL